MPKPKLSSIIPQTPPSSSVESNQHNSTDHATRASTKENETKDADLEMVSRRSQAMTGTSLSSLDMKRSGEEEFAYRPEEEKIRSKKSKKKNKKKKKKTATTNVTVDAPSQFTPKNVKIFRDGTYVRIASAHEMDSLPRHRWVDIFGPKAETVKRDYKLWAGFYADIDGEMDDRDKSYCIRNVKRLNPGSVVADIEAGAWWPNELLSLAGERPQTGSDERGTAITQWMDSPGRTMASLAFLDIQRLAERAIDSTKSECRLFWQEILKVEPDVCMRRHPYDQETICHKLVRLDKRKSLKALIHLKAKMDPRLENAAGHTAIHYACHHRSFKTIAQLVGQCASAKVWVSAPDLVQVAKQYPSLVQPYLDEMGFGKDGIDSKTRRFPLAVDSGSGASKFHVIGAQNVSEQEMWADERDKELMRRRSPYHVKLWNAVANLDFSDRAISSDTTEIAVKTRYISCKNIAGPYPNVDVSPIGAFLECGCDDIFTTKVMRAVLDFKWELFGGAKHRWRVLHYFLYIVAVTVTMWDMHHSSDSGKWSDLDFNKSETIEQLIFVDIFFILTTAMMIRNDLIGIWKSPGLEYYMSPNIGAWNVACSITMAANLYIFLVKKIEGVSETMDADGITGYKAMNTICAWTTLLTWINMIGLLRPFPSCGPFINMVMQITYQILPFLLLFVMVLWAFGFAFYMSVPRFSNTTDFSDNPTEMSFEDPFAAFAVTFLMSVGEFADYLQLLSSESYFKGSTLVLFIIFLIIVFLILFNLLIAIMGEAYNEVISDGTDDDWRFFQCSIICEQEKRLGDVERTDAKRFPAWLHVIEPNIPTFKSPMSDGEEAVADIVKDALKDLKRELTQSVTEETRAVENRLSTKIDSLSKLMDSEMKKTSKKRV